MPPTTLPTPDTSKISTAFAPSAIPSGLTSDQQTAYKGVADAFTPPATQTSSSTSDTSGAKKTYVGDDGKTYYQSSSGGGLATTTTTVDGVDLAAADRKALDETNAAFQAQAKQVHDTILGIQNGSVPLSAGEQAQVAGLQQQFGALIDQQKLINTGASGIANTRGYQTGAAEYDPTFQVKTIGAIVTAGINKVADLQTKEASAVATLTQSLKDNDIAAVKDAWTVYQAASKDRKDALQKTIDDTQKAIKDAQDKQQKITDQVNTIATDAAKNGADPKTLKAISAATNVTDALNAAGTSLQTATGQLGDYLQYKRDTIAKGLTPTDYGTWKAQDDAQKAKADASAAYSKAYATAKGTADAGNLYGPGTTDSATIAEHGAQGITQATGLSLQAFNYLTQGTPSMSRMPVAQRNQIMAEANAYLNKAGVDVATFQSQYKAYNEVLEKNIARANQTKIMAGEVSGSADSLINIIDSKDLKGDPFNPLSGGLTNLRPSIIVDLYAGKQLNNPYAIKYKTQLQFMANDLAGYLAAARGSTQPELQDIQSAAEIISNGLSKGSVQGFKNEVVNNETKITGVVNKAAADAQKQVWDLFGVGAQFQPHPSQVNPKEAVNSYVSSNPAQAETVAKLYEVPGATDQDVLDYINQLKK